MTGYSTVLIHQTSILLEIIFIELACKYVYASDNLLNLSNLKLLPILIRENLLLFVQCFQQIVRLVLRINYSSLLCAFLLFVQISIQYEKRPIFFY